MSGLPSGLLAKWATPFDHETARLKEFLPLGPYPNHLTQDKCLELHAIYCDAVRQTEELEGIVASKLNALKRKRSHGGGGGGGGGSSSSILNKTPAATGAGAGGGGGSTAERDRSTAVAGGSGGGAKEKQTQSQQQQQQQPKKKKKKKNDRGRSVNGGSEGQSKNKKRKGAPTKDSKRSAQQGPAWATRTPKARDQVAAKVEDEALWILATVEKHNEKKGMFVVVDDDDAGDGKRRQFKLRRSNILTLPRPEEASGAIFPVGSRVMTLYPQTTTFYPATISGPFVEGRDGGEDFCVMQFQDDDPTPEGVLPHWRLPARFVRARS